MLSEISVTVSRKKFPTRNERKFVSLLGEKEAICALLTSGNLYIWMPVAYLGNTTSCDRPIANLTMRNACGVTLDIDSAC